MTTNIFTKLKRALSLLLAISLVMSGMSLDVFADPTADPLMPDSVKIREDGITLTKTAVRTGADEWIVTVHADIEDKPIEQKPLEVVFVLDRSGSMNWCTDPSHDDQSKAHTHDNSCYELVCDLEEHTHVEGECFNYTCGIEEHSHTKDACYTTCTRETNPDHYEYNYLRGWWVHKSYGTGCQRFGHNSSEYYELTCEKAQHSHTEGCKTYTCDLTEHTHDSNCKKLICELKKYSSHERNNNDKCILVDGNTDDDTRLNAAVSAINNMVSELPDGTRVRYVTFAGSASDVSDSLSNVSAKGGTIIMSGVDKAITSGFTQSSASRKILVLVSDGEDNKGTYSSGTLDNFGGDVFTVGFMLDNQNLRSMVKGKGQYYSASNASSLVDALEDINKFALSMITDPMGEDVELVSGTITQNTSGIQGVIETAAGNTIHWIPDSESEIKNNFIEYSYKVKVKNPATTAGTISGIQLNDTTTFQYSTEDRSGKVGHLENFNIPAGTYSVSTLTTNWVSNNTTLKTAQFEDVISDWANDGFTVQEVPDTIPAGGHNYYVYDDTTVTKNGASIETAYDAVAPTNGDAYVVTHNYHLEEMYEVTYEYTNHTDLKSEAPLPEAKLYAPDADVEIAAEPSVRGYIFNGWTIDGAKAADFKMLNKDVKVRGSWIEAPTYNAAYSFISGDENRALPVAINDYLPEDDDDYYDGDTVTAKNPETTSYTVTNNGVTEGTWTFDKYENDTQTVDGADVEFVGVWNFKQAERYGVTYEFKSAKADKTLPADVTALLPNDTGMYYESVTVYASAPAKTVVTVREGSWEFKGYDADSKTMTSSGVHFIGTWDFTEGQHYRATYEFVSGESNKPLPEEIIALTPSDDAIYYNNDVVNAKNPSKTSVSVTEGTWTFEKYENTSLTVNNANVHFVGTWKFTEGTKYGVSYKYVSGTTGKDLPDAINDFKPDDGRAFYNTETVSPYEPTQKTYQVTEGTWTFQEYDAVEKTVDKADVEFIGTWGFEEGVKYGVSYKFVSGTEGMTLPEKINEYKPADNRTFYNTEKVEPFAPIQKIFDVLEGTWTFQKYDADEKIVNKADVKFIGTWTFEEGEKYNVSYRFISGTDGVALPPEVLANRPTDAKTYYDTEVVDAIRPANEEVAAADGSVWTFQYYDKSQKTIQGADIEFVGLWTRTGIPSQPMDLYAKYFVEYYLETAYNTGDYAQAGATEIYADKIDSSVSAEIKSFTNYTYNADISKQSGVVVMPTVVDNELNVLTLKLYYEADGYAVIYHDGYSNAAPVIDGYTSNADFTVWAVGATGFTRSGYTFRGWSVVSGSGAADEEFAAGNEITLKLDENRTLVVLDAEGNIIATADENGQLTLLSAAADKAHEINLYAVWAKNSKPKKEDPEDPVDIETPAVIEEPEIIDEIPEEDVPLAALPDEPDEFEIFEEEVPLADVPTTGDGAIIWMIMAVMSALGLAVLTIEEKKARKF